MGNRTEQNLRVALRPATRGRPTAEPKTLDAVFRALPVVALPGYSRPMIRAEQYLELVEHHTYRDDRVRPCHA